MSFSQYISKRIPEIKISHPHLINHKQRIGVIFREWQSNNIEDIISKVIKRELSITEFQEEDNSDWTKEEEEQLIDKIIFGYSHSEIASFHKRSVKNIEYMLYMIAIRLLKENKTTVTDITVIFDLDYEKFAKIVNYTSKF